MTLDIAISTYRHEGIERVVKMLRPLSSHEGVKYIVSWQEHENLPVPDYLRSRKDVEVIRLDLRGLSNNRNNALEHCRGDIILIADDDLEFESDFAEKIVRAFESNPDMGLGLFKIGNLSKVYPVENCDVTVPFPRGYYVTSMEIAFRRDKIGNLRFYPQLGLGAPVMRCGEEELFVLSAIKRGIRCVYINDEIATHPEETTGDRISDGILRGQGFVIRILYPFSSILRLPLKAYRSSKKGSFSFIKSLFFLLDGAFISLISWRKIPKEYRW